MANNRIVMSGLFELREALRNLPAHLRDEAQEIVQATAEGARDEIRDAYPEVTGNLKRGLTLKAEHGGQFGVSYLLRNRAKHSWLFEHGSQARHTDLGANRGSMPARPTFIPIVSRRRRDMYQSLIQLLEREGLTVTGTP